MHLFPVLHTTRLTLRQLNVDDLPNLVQYANNRAISAAIVNIPYPYQEFNAVMRLSYVVKGFQEKSRFVFAIVLKETSGLVGEISLHFHDNNRKDVAEMGYWVGEPFWNQGIASEAIEAVLKFGFDTLGIKAVYATCHADNVPSQKVLLKNGLQPAQENGSVIQFVLRP
jgi:[ribosomal protein S5]-alanine N-acetyltransferase